MENKVKKPIISLKEDDFSYEKDPRFVEFMKQRVEASYDRSRLIDGHEATKQICEKLGLHIYDNI